MGKAHKGQILALKNQTVPIDETTVFHASYDNDLIGRDTKGREISPVGFENSLSFSLSGEAEIVQNINSTITDKLTVEAWYYPTVNNNNVQAIVAQWNSSADGSFLLYQNKNYFTFIVSNGDGTFSATDSAVVTMNRWYHVCGTYSGTHITLYVDGVYITSQPKTGILSNAYKTVIGAYSNKSSASRSAGRFNDVRIWNVLKAASDVKEGMYRTLTGSEAGLVAYLKFNEGSGNVAYDSSVNGNDAIITGGTWARGRSITSLRPFEGKFNGGMAVESGTTNLSQTRDNNWRIVISNFQGTCTITTGKNRFNTSARFDFRPKLDPEANGYQLASYQHRISTWTIGATYTWSIYIRKISNHDVSVKLLDANGLNPQGGTAITIGGIGEWQRISHTWTPTVATGGSDFYIIAPNVSSFEVADPQIEQKDFPTSFTVDGRPQGKLQYLNPLYGQPNLTVNFWLKFPVYTPTTSAIWLEEYDGILSAPWVGLTTTGLEPFWVSSDGYKGTWNMYTLVKTGQKLECYINGVLVRSVTGAYYANTFSAGKLINVGSRYTGEYIGNFIMDELRMDRVARPQDEIISWYLADAPFYNDADRLGVIK